MRKILLLALAAGIFFLAAPPLDGQTTISMNPPGTVEVTSFSRDLSPILGVNAVRHFVTADAAEVAAINYNRSIDPVNWNWFPRSDHFLVYTAPRPGLVAVMRFATRDEVAATKGFSHVFIPYDATVASEYWLMNNEPGRIANWRLETPVPAFYAALPQYDAVTGEAFCATGHQGIYRFYNMGSGGIDNHAYTASFKKRVEFAEKYGVDEGIRFCVPAVTDKVVVANFDSGGGDVGPNNCLYNSSVFDVASLTSRDICSIGLAPKIAEVSKRDGFAKLALWSSVTSIDIDEAKVVSSVFQGPYQWLAVDDEHSRIYATRAGHASEPGSVYELDLMSGEILREFPGGGVPGYTPFVIKLIGDKLYIANTRSGISASATNANDWVTVLDRATGTVLQRIAVNAYPWDMAYDPKRGYLYVSSTGDFNSSAYPTAVLAIDVRTDTVVKDLRYPKMRAIGLFVDTARDELWVSNSTSFEDSSLEVLDLASGKWTATFPTHWLPAYMTPVMRADGTREVWVGHRGGKYTEPENFFGIGRYNMDTKSMIQKRMPSGRDPLGLTSRKLYE